MPEGPEIRREADRVGAAIAGREAEAIRFAHPHLRRFAHLLEGEEVAAVDARGKAILTRFANGLVVYSHNQLYGRWWVRPRGSLPATRRELRFAVHTRERSALLYSASEIDVLEAERLELHPYLSKLGPDVLDLALSPEDVEERLRARAFRGRALGALLLDQTFLAGLGNYLRAEILFRAGLRPERRPADCTPAELRRLARAAPALARRAYQSGGVTVEAATFRRKVAAGTPRRHARFHVFSRAGLPCPRCDARIERISAAGRRCYVCPRCQPVRTAR